MSVGKRSLEEGNEIVSNCCGPCPDRRIVRVEELLQGELVRRDEALHRGGHPAADALGALDQRLVLMRTLSTAATSLSTSGAGLVGLRAVQAQAADRSDFQLELANAVQSDRGEIAALEVAAIGLLERTPTALMSTVVVAQLP